MLLSNRPTDRNFSPLIVLRQANYILSLALSDVIIIVVILTFQSNRRWVGDLKVTNGGEGASGGPGAVRSVEIADQGLA